MAKVKIQGHASGTGIITLTAPNTSTDRTVTLPDADVTLGASPVTALNNATANELVTVGATTTELDAETNLTFDGTDLTLGTGNLVIGTAGKGIDFSAQTGTSVTGAATTGDEVLDHYEEGTWTPTISGSSTCSIGTVHNAHYTRVGNKVTLYSAFRVDSSADPATGTMIFGGFPFAFKTLGESAFLISVYYNYRECPNAFMTVSGYTFYTNTTVGGNNLGDLTAALDDANTFGMNFTYLTN